MKLLFRQNIIATLGLLAVLSFSISYWLFRTQMGMPLIPVPISKYFQTKTTNVVGFRNGLKNLDPDFYIRQHGQYWVLYNYIKSENKITGNDSVTLVVHGDWTDVINLSETFQRWEGPISLTLFACGEDFVKAINVLVCHMRSTLYGEGLYHFVSINFILHQDFLPKVISLEELAFKFNSSYCLEEIEFSTNERLQHNLTFPSNLARNVGRLTARTHFVLLLDVDVIPSVGISKLFLEMIKAKENADHPQKTVYILPSFDIKLGHIVPEREYELRALDQQFLQLYLNSKSLHKIPRLREWLEATNKSETGIFDKIKNWGHRLAYYISANDIEPFYDENYDSESQIDRIGHLDILEALDYNFYVVNLGFVVRRLLPPYKFYTEMPLNNDTEVRLQKLKIKILKDFYMNFM